MEITEEEILKMSAFDRLRLAQSLLDPTFDDDDVDMYAADACLAIDKATSRQFDANNEEEERAGKVNAKCIEQDNVAYRQSVL